MIVFIKCIDLHFMFHMTTALCLHHTNTIPFKYQRWIMNSLKVRSTLFQAAVSWHKGIILCVCVCAETGWHDANVVMCLVSLEKCLATRCYDYAAFAFRCPVRLMQNSGIRTWQPPISSQPFPVVDILTQKCLIFYGNVSKSKWCIPNIVIASFLEQI